MEDFTLNDGNSNPGMEGFRDNTKSKLPVVNWLADLPETQTETDLVEVQFKNTRKGYFHNNTNIPLEKGDQVAVEASPGHDIGTITLMGRLVPLQMKKNRINLERYEVRRVYRKVRPVDIEKYEEAKAKEHATMIRSRQLAKDLNLSMKIGDVEFQGDGSKAIFYYIADERVDFRQLIRVFADEFRVRIEMKQIGARQEAGRIGGIGPCGRELCCATWMNNFVSVSTNSARFQDLSTNPLKLAGQCAKIKCCVNYEMGMYADLKRDFPGREIRLETKDGTYFHFKSDIFKKEITFSTDPRMPANLVTLPLERVQDILAVNRKGEKVDHLTDNSVFSVEIDYQNVVGQDDLTRFDSNGPKRKRKNRRKNTPNKEGDRPQERRNNGPRKEGDRPQERRTNGPRKEGDRPQERRTNGPRKEGDRPQERRTNGPRKEGDRPQERRTNGPRKEGDRPQERRTNGPRKEGDRPQERRNNGPRKEGDRPQERRNNGPRKEGDRPQERRTNGPRKEGDRPQERRTNGPRKEGDRPQERRTNGPRKEGNRPQERRNQPTKENPKAPKPVAKKPVAQKEAPKAPINEFKPKNL